MKKLVICLAFTACMTSFKAYSSNSIELPHITIDTTIQDTSYLQEFVGKYTFTGLPFEVLEVTIKEAGKIHIEAGERGGDVAPQKDDPDAFETPEAMLKFIRDDNKKVVELKVDASGMSFKGSKVQK
jgi:hypothetical protein